MTAMWRETAGWGAGVSAIWWMSKPLRMADSSIEEIHSRLTGFVHWQRL